MKFKVALCALALVAATVSAEDAVPAPSILARVSSAVSNTAACAKDGAAKAIAATKHAAVTAATATGNGIKAAAVATKNGAVTGAGYVKAAPAQALAFAKAHPYKASTAVVALVGSYMIYRSCSAKACKEDAEQA